MPPPSSSSSRSGATLVEVLVALGIGVMVVAIVVVAHHTLSKQAGRQLSRQKSNERADRTLNELRLDLHQLFVSPDHESTGITLDNSHTNLVSFSFCRWSPRIGRSFPPTNRLERVAYFFEATGDDAELIRTIKALYGPDSMLPAITNRLGSTWPRLLIQLYDGEIWQTNWPFAGMEKRKNDPPRPQAARIQLMGESTEPAFETVVVIPSGLSVTSTIRRVER
jgi:hypothetical protein